MLLILKFCVNQINLTQQKKELSCYLRFMPLAEMVSCPTAHTLTWASIHKKTCAFTQCIALTNSKNSPHLRSQGLFTYLEASSGCWLLLEYPIKWEIRRMRIIQDKWSRSQAQSQKIWRSLRNLNKKWSPTNRTRESKKNQIIFYTTVKKISQLLWKKVKISKHSCDSSRVMQN